MLAINKWFDKYSKKPLLFFFTFIFILQFAFLLTTFQKSFKEQNDFFTSIHDLIRMGVNNNNRDLIDTTFQLAIKKQKTKSIILCNKNDIELYAGIAGGTCDSTSTFFLKKAEFLFDGQPQYRLIFTYSITSFVHTINIIFFILSIIALWSSLLLNSFLEKMFRKDIISPLQQGDINNIRIKEIFELFETQIKSAQKEKELELKDKYAQEILTITAQVSHDIRSPLTALDMAVKEAENLPEDLRIIIRGSTARIRDIANNLLAKDRTSKGASEANTQKEKITESLLLSSAIESLISEKRMQFRSKLGIQIEFDLSTEAYGLFSKVELREFKRILSNLINNSVEALKDGGLVHVTLASNENMIEIKVTDNGAGIPPEILVKLGQKGETFGKVEGNGLGLYHARTTLESWGGSLKFESTIGTGTIITIGLPKMPAPSWFVEKLKFTTGQRIVVIDDDSSIHQIWDGRFQSSIPSEAQVEIVHLSTPELAKVWFAENKSQKETQYLVDFEFIGSNMNGLKLIKELGVEAKAILVTSRYEEEHIMKRCLEEKILLLPKNLSAFVPIKMSEPSDYVEYVYIEDDTLLRMGWERVAKKKKIKLLTIESQRIFDIHLNKIDPDNTKIYIDSSLGKDEIKGEDFAKILYDKGYKHLFIATGYEKELFAHLPWLKHSGKDCPFDDEE